MRFSQPQLVEAGAERVDLVAELAVADRFDLAALDLEAEGRLVAEQLCALVEQRAEGLGRSHLIKRVVFLEIFVHISCPRFSAFAAVIILFCLSLYRKLYGLSTECVTSGAVRA